MKLYTRIVSGHSLRCDIFDLRKPRKSKDKPMQVSSACKAGAHGDKCTARYCNCCCHLTE